MENDNIIWGYARVSTKEQNLDRQIKRLQEYVKNDRNILYDKASGKSFDRPVWNSLIGTDQNRLLRKGDTLIITSLDRLGRNIREMTTVWQKLADIGCKIKILDMPILDTRDEEETLDNQLITQITLTILSYVADREHTNIKERQREGIDAMPVINGKRVSKKTHRPMGRPEIKKPEKFEQVYERVRSKEITNKQAYELLGLKKSKYYQFIKEIEGGDIDGNGNGIYRIQ